MITTLSFFYRAMAWLAAVAMVATLVCVLLGVLGRQLGFNIPGLDAYAGYAIAAALFLALPETLRRGDHIRVTLVLERLPPRWRNAFEYACLIAAAGLACYLAWFACRMAWQSHSFNDVSQGADATPLWIPQMAMALGCIGLAISLLDALLARWQGRAFFLPATGETAHVE
jgi:TRAP-type C4-dicarboxylate transport system permease small subunit